MGRGELLRAVRLGSGGVLDVGPSAEGRTVTVLVAGDLCPAASAAFMRPAEEGPLRELLDLTRAADVAVVNLECPLTERPGRQVKSGPALHASPAAAAVISDAGFGVVCLANNHILDAGQQGLRSTLEACREAGLQTVGAGVDLPEASRPLVVEAGGASVALVAMAEREFSTATDTRGGAAPIDLDVTAAALRAAQDAAGVVIALVHAGREHEELPSPWLARLCAALADLGADAVVCHHAHVPSGVALHRSVPIAFGTGNLYFPWHEPRPPGWYAGYVVELTASAEGVERMRLVPYRYEVAEDRLRLLDGDEAAGVFQHLEELSAVIADPDALQEHFADAARRQRAEYLARVLCLTRVERRLLKAGVWPWWRVRRSRMPQLLNTYTCESHRENCIALLSEEVDAL